MTEIRIDSSDKADNETMVDGMIQFDVDDIREHIICPLCNGVYREPYTTIKCFHSFCKSCLMVCLQASYFDSKTYNMCPAHGCLVYFGKDSDIGSIAIADRTLQTIIEKVLFPDLMKKDKEEEEAFYRARGIERKETAKKSSEAPSGAESNTRNPQRTVNIKFRLEPIENSPPLDCPVIETDGKIRIKELKKYLAVQLDTTTPISIFCDNVPLGDELSAIFVQRSVWMETNGIMSLSYRVFAS